MTSKRKPFQTQLRRSISEQLRDSTTRAWDLLWKTVRERRLAGRCPRLRTRGGGRRRNPVVCSGSAVQPPLYAPTPYPYRVQSLGLGRAGRAHTLPGVPEHQPAAPRALWVWALPGAGTDSLAGCCARGWEPGQRCPGELC